MAKMNKLTKKGATPFPALRTEGKAPKIMMIWEIPQTTTPITMVLYRPSLASATHAPKMGMT